MRVKDFDQDFIKTIEKLAHALKVKPAVMLENIFIRRIAEDRAERDIYFNEPVPMMIEFLTYGGKLKRGFELYEMMYNIARDRVEREYIDNLAAVPWEALTEQDKVILSRRGVFPGGEKKKKQAAELKEKHNIPKTKPGENSHWEE